MIVVIIALVVVFLVGLVPTMRGVNPLISWGISCVILPALILFDEFVLPYRGGGASMWPIALFMAGIMGIAVGGLGTLIGVAIKNRKKEEHK
jgi:hypothetical protein